LRDDREHHGMGRYPEHELWEAVDGYLGLVSASGPTPPNADASPDYSGGS
jgi:hypothetical protein